ncbi:16347_t:CDS:2, partial [Acaulospora colombiana]
HKESVEMLEGALKTIAVSMANCEFYASIFTEALDRQFTSPGTTLGWEKQLETALPEFYAAVLVFSIKLRGYFMPLHLGRFANPFKPFSESFRLHLTKIENKEKILKQLATMATMESVKVFNRSLLTDIQHKVNVIGEMKELFVQISDEKALKWLNAFFPKPVYDFNKDRRLEGTCEWIFKTEKYRSWIN